MFQICRRLTQPRIGITSCRVIAKFLTEQDLRVMRFISICLQLLKEKKSFAEKRLQKCFVTFSVVGNVTVSRFAVN